MAAGDPGQSLADFTDPEFGDVKANLGDAPRAAGPVRLEAHTAVHAAGITDIAGVAGIITGAGDDIVWGSAGNDTILTGTGNDLVFGLGGDDLIDGGDGDDTLEGGAGNDTVFGGTGNDILIAGPGSDSYDGGMGFDVLTFARPGSGLPATGAVLALDYSLTSAGAAEGLSFARHTIESVIGTIYDDHLRGSIGNNTLNGNAGNDLLEGGLGDDFLIGGAGNDVLDGGEGRNTANYASSPGAVAVNLSDSVRQAGSRALDAGTALDGFGGTDRLIAISNVITASGDDHIIGTDWNNILRLGGGDDVALGLSGDDILDGGAGRDRLEGGEGADLLTGGAGADTFVFQTGGGRDRIADFNAGEGDVIELNGLAGVDIAGLLAGARQVGTDTVLGLGEGQGIVLAGTDKTTLAVDDFVVIG